MEHTIQLRIIRLLLLMLTNRTKTVYDFASMLGVSYRTVYRYMDLFQEVGLLVEKLGGGVYKIDPCSKPLKTLRDMLNAQVGRISSGEFTPEGFQGNTKKDDVLY